LPHDASARIFVETARCAVSRWALLARLSVGTPPKETPRRGLSTVLQRFSFDISEH